MNTRHTPRNWTLGLWALWLVMSGILPVPAWADPPPASSIPVLVMGEDGNKDTISRDSNIFRRVLGELKTSMARHGFRMLDEEMLAVDLNWQITARRPKTELIQASKLANAKGDSRYNHRAMVLFSIFASKKELNAATELHTRIEGEIYDALTRQFVGRFEFPNAVYPAAKDCNEVCINNTVGDKSREIAMNLGDVLGKMLAFLQPQPVAFAPQAVVATPQQQQPVAAKPTPATNAPATVKTKGNEVPLSQSPAPSTATHTMMTTYGVTFKRFNSAEILSIIGVMTSEFPGFSSTNIIEQASALQKYDYVTTATSAKMVEWLNILLMDLGLTDKNVVIQVEGNQITLDKITPTPNPAANRQGPRFK
ncbi:hypothetical protein SIID45300_02238 [Candidatus Magnetaquicoccaceae bacterium FCR-1]|uniref:Uncharacterized protein n=1 Tax=Candidatus Magnetaquiglobus chichijimensis TaxID=3141448 RepID=A0ABQ0CAJ1_9PROT